MSKTLTEIGFRRRAWEPESGGAWEPESGGAWEQESVGAREPVRWSMTTSSQSAPIPTRSHALRGNAYEA